MSLVHRSYTTVDYSRSQYISPQGAAAHSGFSEVWEIMKRLPSASCEHVVWRGDWRCRCGRRRSCGCAERVPGQHVQGPVHKEHMCMRVRETSMQGGGSDGIFSASAWNGRVLPRLGRADMLGRGTCKRWQESVRSKMNPYRGECMLLCVAWRERIGRAGVSREVKAGGNARWNLVRSSDAQQRALLD